MIRTPKTTIIIAVILLILIFLTALHPMFDTKGETTLEALLADEPLTMPDYPGALREILDETTRHRIRDRWGFIYPPSGSVDLNGAALRAGQTQMDRALEQYETGRFRRALTILDYDYNVYIGAVTGGADLADSMPTATDGLVLYGLYRYNRAYGLFQMAGGLRRSDPKREEFLKKALYDMRRAVGAFETLGKGGNGPSPYWGEHYNAWEGSLLDQPGHGEFPIHQAYANLSTAYLRVEDLPGYPGIQLGYMRRERDKYRLSDSELSAVVSSLVNSCLQQRNGLDPVKYRLTMALQNLEAASRGMKQGSEARFNYMIGIILSHLQGYDEQVTYADAIAFLELAARERDRAADPKPCFAAQKELALIYLIVGEDARALDTLSEIDPSALRDLIAGSDRDYGLLFTDIAQYAHLARGDISRMASHLSLRQNEFNTGKSEAEIETLHDRITGALAVSFARSLYRRCRQLVGDGKIAEVSHLLQSLDTELQAQPVLHEAYRKHCYRRARWSPSIRVNLALEKNPGWATFFAWAPLWLTLLLVLLLADFYRAQQRVARTLFQSGYRHDIQN